MTHGVVTDDGCIERGAIQQVAFDEPATASCQGLLEKLTAAKRHVIERGDVRPGRDQPVHERAADKPGTAGDKHATAAERIARHRLTSRNRPLRPLAGAACGLVHCAATLKAALSGV